MWLMTGSFLTALLFLDGLKAAGVKVGREEGEFRIFVSGREIGTEKFVIVASGDSASSTSIVQFRNPAEKHQKVQFETRLNMDGHYVPRNYELKSDVDGQRGDIVGTFSSNQAIFQYSGGPSTRKSGLMVGDKFTLLDTNIFHHFIFLVRLYDFDSREKTQQFEVAIPQEPDSGFLKITELKRENITVRGKKMDAHHLRADSGTMVVDLWVDSQRILYKIVVRSKEIEVVRD
jgi:hypothetical protein